MRRKPSAPVSARPSSRSTAPASTSSSMRTPPPVLLTPLQLQRALAGEEVAEIGRDQRREPAAEVDVEAEAVVAAAQLRQALGDAVAGGVEREGDVDVLERALARQPQVDRRLGSRC